MNRISSASTPARGLWKQLSRNSQRLSGFTLIELLVVILIIGILLAIALPTFLNQQDKANDTAVKTQLDTGYKVAASDAVERNGDFGSVAQTVDAITSSEPELHVAALDQAANATEGTVGVVTASQGDLLLAEKSKSGKICTLKVSGHVKDGPTCQVQELADDGGDDPGPGDGSGSSITSLNPAVCNNDAAGTWCVTAMDISPSCNQIQLPSNGSCTYAYQISAPDGYNGANFSGILLSNNAGNGFAGFGGLYKEGVTGSPVGQGGIPANGDTTFTEHGTFICYGVSGVVHPQIHISDAPNFGTTLTISQLSVDCTGPGPDTSNDPDPQSQGYTPAVQATGWPTSGPQPWNGNKWSNYGSADTTAAVWKFKNAFGSGDLNFYCSLNLQAFTPCGYGPDSSVSYSNLGPGIYTLRVFASDDNRNVGQIVNLPSVRVSG